MVDNLNETSTKRSQLELQLLHAQKLESIGQLAAGIAHEINTPIQYVGDNTKFLQKSFEALVPLLKKSKRLTGVDRDDAGAAALADELKAELEEADVDFLATEIPGAIDESLMGIARVRKIVQSIKEFSHPGVEGMSSVDLNRALESTTTVATNEWKYVATVETDFDVELPLVSCLPGDLNQAFLNLIVNAAHTISDATQGGEDMKGTITISTRRDGEFGRYVSRTRAWESRLTLARGSLTPSSPRRKSARARARGSPSHTASLWENTAGHSVTRPSSARARRL